MTSGKLFNLSELQFSYQRLSKNFVKHYKEVTRMPGLSFIFNQSLTIILWRMKLDPVLLNLLYFFMLKIENNGALVTKIKPLSLG